jgi:hypothetical protein
MMNHDEPRRPSLNNEFVLRARQERDWAAALPT